MIKNKFKETEIGKIPEDWEVVKLVDVADILTGFPFKGEKYSSQGIRVLRGENVSVGFIRWDADKKWNHSIEGLEKYFLVDSDIVIGMDGSKVGQNRARIQNGDLPLLLAQRVTRLRANKKLNQIYLYYIVFSDRFFNYVESIKTGTSIPHISSKQIAEFKMPLPFLPEQRSIAKILSSLDSKISLNRSMNSTLESVGQALFKHWFVDFEFPNEEGKPYKSGGGEMVNSELGEVPKGWKVGKLGEIMENFDSKRVPLSSRERASKKGTYPYYGAASIMDYVDDYLFEGRYLLIGEDGTVIDENEHPILQYVWGKFWVNNHAHVIQSKDGFPTEYIMLLLKQTNVRHMITGAVQPKINQENMNRLKVLIPHREILTTFSKLIDPIFERYRTTSEETTSLAKIRDALLPKLMSGELRINVR